MESVFIFKESIILDSGEKSFHCIPFSDLDKAMEAKKIAIEGELEEIRDRNPELKGVEMLDGQLDELFTERKVSFLDEMRNYFYFEVEEYQVR